MKKSVTKLASAAAALTLFAALLPGTAFAADEPEGEASGKASVTVNVYSSDTGELFSEDDIVVLFDASSEEAYKKGVAKNFDMWHVSGSEPHTVVDVPVYDEWKYYFILSWNDYDGYFYQLEDAGWTNGFSLSDGEEKTVDLYIKKVYDPGVMDSFLVYLGSDKTGGTSQLMQFYPDSGNPELFRKRQVTYLGEVGEDAAYGDIYKTDEPVILTGSVTERKLGPLEHLAKTGNICDECEKLTLSVSSVRTSTGLDPSRDTLQLTMSADDGSSYNYSVRLKNMDFPYNFDKIRRGDRIGFYTIGKNIIIPSGQYEHIPRLMGDVNEDREFTVADVVLIQKWLLGAEDVRLSDWTAADFCKDGVLDCYDLCMMRTALIVELSIPHVTMSVHVVYGGYGVTGQDLGHGEFTKNYTVRKGDWFFEMYDGSWLKNEKVYENDGVPKIISITDLTDEGVEIITQDIEYPHEENVQFLKFGETQGVPSRNIVADGINFDYDVTFLESNDTELSE